ncbi:hypothetical protein GCM10009602_36540 [Nocardiopsis tropica]
MTARKETNHSRRMSASSMDGSHSRRCSDGRGNPPRTRVDGCRVREVRGRGKERRENGYAEIRGLEKGGKGVLEGGTGAGENRLGEFGGRASERFRMERA